MDINKILKELRSEREEIDRAIIALERVGDLWNARPPVRKRRFAAHSIAAKHLSDKM